MNAAGHDHDHRHRHRHRHGNGSHNHGSGGHHHHHPDARQLAGDPVARRALTLALVIAFAFLIVEVVGGVLANSLALLSDAAHMATDCAAYAIALWAARVAQRPPTTERTYGYGRAEILAALLNGATLLAASAWIVVEATRRLLNPVEVAGGGVMLVAGAGLVANIGVVLVLARADRHNLNIRGAFLHAVTDAASSVAVLISGALVLVAGLDRADAVVSYLIAGLVVWGSFALVRDCVALLLDSAPAGLPADTVATALLKVEGVNELHDVHVWTFAPGTPAVSAHARVDAWADRDLVLHQLQSVLRDQLGVSHSTLQITGDRSTKHLDMVERMPLADAVEWATEHVVSTRPDLARGVIMAAAGVAAMAHRPGDRVSPVALSLRTLQMLRGGAPAVDRGPPTAPS